MGKFLIALSGARAEVLAQCPTERTKFQSLGWAILITSVMAVISMWFALTSVMGFNPVLMFPVAVIWGLIIMGIDRWLIVSMPATGSRRLAMALPRLLLALLLGSIISTPIVLRIFQSEINNQISVIKENREAGFLASQQRSQIAARVTTWSKAVDNLQRVINSRGEQAINPASDPVIQNLTRQLNDERASASRDYRAWQCQLYGGCGAPKGSGPLAAASKARYQRDESQVSLLTSEIQAREKQLQDTSAASQQSRLQQAQNALPNARAQLMAAQAEENSLTNSFQTTNNATNGLLIRLQALDQISAGNATLNMARFLLFLLFLVIECLPVTVKLLQRPGNYEKVFAAMARRELNNAHKALREDRVLDETRENAGFPGVPGATPQGGTLREPSGARDGYPGARGNSARRWGGADSIDTAIGDIWRTGSQTKTMTPDAWQATVPAESSPPQPSPAEPARPGPAAPTRHEEALDHVTDLGPEEPHDDRRARGIQELYNDDDL